MQDYRNSTPGFYRTVWHKGVDASAGMRDEIGLWKAFISDENKKKLANQLYSYSGHSSGLEDSDMQDMLLIMKEVFSTWYADEPEKLHAEDCNYNTLQKQRVLLDQLNEAYKTTVMQEREIAHRLDERHRLRMARGHIRWYTPETSGTIAGNMNPWADQMPHKEVVIHRQPTELKRGWNSEVKMEW